MYACYEVFLSLLNANWSSWPMVIIIVICLVDHFYHNEISALLGRVSVVKWGEKQIELNLKEIKQGQMSNEYVDKDYNELKKCYEYEIIYNWAYGTQLQMLIAMKNMGNNPMLYQNAINYFLYHRSLLPMNGQIVADEVSYFKWLQDRGVVVRQVDGSFILTPKGIDFVRYIYMANYNINLKMF